MELPIYDALLAHQKKRRAGFHMPGHKGRAAPLSFLGRTLALDTTELPDTGSLFDGEGAPARAERLATALFGTAGTFLSAGGCTLCIQAMLRLAAPQGGKILAGRVVHRSAVHAMALLDLEPVWIWPRRDAGERFAGRIAAEDVAAQLRCHPDVKLIYLTSPDYDGVMSDIRGIVREAAPYGAPVLVDNAHGAHLAFLDGALHPIRQGAVMSADSAHKTLPVLTGGAWLQLARKEDCRAAREAMALFGSTSPSYPIMASLDACRAWLEQDGARAFAALREQTDALRALAESEGYGLPVGPCDPLRVSLDTAARGISGTAAAGYLRARGIEPEYADAAGVILIPSPFNTRGDFSRLCRALRTMPRAGEQPPVSALPPEPPVSVMTPREALLALCEAVPITAAAGRIAAETACPCPPAIPVVMPGERITAPVVTLLERYGISKLNVVK